MKYVYFVFAIIILSVALGGCVPSEEAKPETVPWVNEWLDSTACKPPCWEGITPGVTTLYQISKETISSNNDLSFEGPTPLSDGSFYFDWKQTENGIVYSTVHAATESDKDMTIGDILFDFGSEGTSITVSDVISHFGDPDYVGIRVDMAGCGGTIFYQDKQVWLNIERKNMSDYYNIDKNTHLSWSFYYSELQRDEHLKKLFPKPDQIQPWTGYGNYICKDVIY